MDDLAADAIMPGGGMGDPVPQPHDIISRSTWLDVLVCRCGVVATADHERQAWVGEDNHVRAFGPFERDPRFYPGQPVTEAPQAPPYTPPVKRALAAEVMAHIGIDPVTLPAAPSADNPDAPITQKSPIVRQGAAVRPPPGPSTVNDPYGAKVARTRAAKDERNRRDRERRLLRWRDAERRGERPRGRRPKV